MKNLMTIVVILIICTLHVNAKMLLPTNKYDTLSCTSHDTIVKTVVEQNAMFQGGTIQKFRDYVGRNIKYPQELWEKTFKCRAYIKFVIDWDGTIKNVELLKSSGYNALDSEAIWIIKKSPKWISAKDQGVCVPQQFVLPIEFVSLGMLNGEYL